MQADFPEAVVTMEAAMVYSQPLHIRGEFVPSSVHSQPRSSDDLFPTHSGLDVTTLTDEERVAQHLRLTGKRCLCSRTGRWHRDNEDWCNHPGHPLSSVDHDPHRRDPHPHAAGTDFRSNQYFGEYKCSGYQVVLYLTSETSVGAGAQLHRIKAVDVAARWFNDAARYRRVDLAKLAASSHIGIARPVSVPTAVEGLRQKFKQASASPFTAVRKLRSAAAGLAMWQALQRLAVAKLLVSRLNEFGNAIDCDCVRLVAALVRHHSSP
eukprot:SAG31_NODE_721_length_12587_cov_5.502002_7_plen_266_part_00